MTLFTILSILGIYQYAQFAQNQGMMSFNEALFNGLLMALLLLGPLLLGFLLEYQKRKKAYPSLIRITKNGLTFDEQVYEWSQLKEVSVTPLFDAQNRSIKKRLIKITSTKDSRTYWFGSTFPTFTENMVYASYDDLIKQLNQALAPYPGVFSLDMS